MEIAILFFAVRVIQLEAGVLPYAVRITNGYEDCVRFFGITQFCESWESGQIILRPISVSHGHRDGATNVRRWASAAAALAHALVGQC